MTASLLVALCLLAGAPVPTVADIDAAFAANDVNRALALANARTAQEPADGMGWVRQGFALQALGKLDEAIAAYQAGEKHGAPVQLTALRIARCQARQGHADQAFAQLDRAVKAGMSRPKALTEDKDLAVLKADPRFAQAVALADAAGHPCRHQPQSQQLDFWVGEWTVTIGGAHVGDSKVDSILDGCVVQENWTSTQGIEGKSFNTYDRALGKWRQTYVDAAGTITDYVGAFEDGAMRYTATQQAKGAPATWLRMTFTPLGKDQVRQLIETSADGKTFTPSFDGLYTRVKRGS